LKKPKEQVSWALLLGCWVCDEMRFIAFDVSVEQAEHHGAGARLV
jgi:hypothetical protein